MIFTVHYLNSGWSSDVYASTMNDQIIRMLSPKVGSNIWVAWLKSSWLPFIVSGVLWVILNLQGFNLCFPFFPPGILVLETSQFPTFSQKREPQAQQGNQTGSKHRKRSTALERSIIKRKSGHDWNFGQCLLNSFVFMMSADVLGMSSLLIATLQGEG